LTAITRITPALPRYRTLALIVRSDGVGSRPRPSAASGQITRLEPAAPIADTVSPSTSTCVDDEVGEPERAHEERDEQATPMTMTQWMSARRRRAATSAGPRCRRRRWPAAEIDVDEAVARRVVAR